MYHKYRSIRNNCTKAIYIAKACIRNHLKTFTIASMGTEICPSIAHIGLYR